MTLTEICRRSTGLGDEAILQLERVAETIQYTADLTGADIFIDCMDKDGVAVVVAQAQPGKESSAYRQTVLGQAAVREKEPAVYHAFRTGLVVRDLKAVTQEDQAVRQDVAPIRGSSGEVIGVLIREKDVSRSISREKKFRELARERESINDSMLGMSHADSHSVAMKEIHHRVKNNLQMVASILNIQARRSSDEHIKQIFRENTGRVLSIAATHDILTSTDIGDEIELKPLLEKLRRSLQSMSPREAEVTISISGDDVTVSADKAASIALVANELITNSLEHGFGGRTNGEITVTVQHGRQNSTIVVQDNGIGFSPDEDRGQSLGLDIISLIVQDKLGGKLQMQSGAGGTTAMFDFN